MKKIVLIFFIIQFSYSCMETNYEQKINSIPQKFIDHLPKKITNDNYKLITNLSPINEESNPVFVFLTIKDNDFYEVLNSNKISYLKKYKSSDSCLLFPNRFKLDYPGLFIGSEEVYEIWNNENSDCLSSKIPIANFYPLGRTSEKNNFLGLEKGFELYVIEAKKGKVFNDKYYIPSDHMKSGFLKQDIADRTGYKLEIDNFPMPNGWGHGFTKGIALNETNKTIIYWFMTW